MRRQLLAAALLAVMIFVVFHPPVIGVGGATLQPGWDATRVFWADLAHLRRCLVEGNLPLWNPHDRAGYSFVAEPQSGVFDPITWVVVLVSVPLGDVPPWLISLKAVLYYILAATGVVALLRRYQLPPWAVTLGILIYVVGGRMDKLKDQSGLWPSAWAPWLLFVLHWALQRPTWRRGVALGTVGGLCVLSGYPPIAVRLAMLLLAPLGLLWFVTSWRTAEDRGAYLGQAARCLGTAVVVVACLCAAQVAATLGVLEMTMRADLPLSQVLGSSMQPRHGLGLWAPGAAKVSVLLYGGLACGLGVVAAAAVQPRLESVLLLALGVLGFLLACGGNAPLLPLVAELPGFRSFRIAGHFVVLSSLASVVLAPLGLRQLSTHRRLGRIVAPVLGVAGLGVFFRFAHEPTTLSSVAVVLSALAVGALPFVPRRRTAWLGWAMVAFVAVDIYGGNRPVAEILQPSPDRDRQALLAGLVEDPGEHRFADFGWARNRAGPNAGGRDLIGARPALTDRHYMLVYKAAPRRHGVLATMGVSIAAFARRPAIVRSLKADPENRGIYRVPDPWPAAFLTRRVQWVDSPKRAIAAIVGDGTPRAVVVRDHVPRGRIEGMAPVAVAEQSDALPPVQLTRVSPNEIAIDLPPVETAALLVVNEGFDPGWRAYVDGAPAPIERVNLLHRAVRVRRGATRVVMRYEPPWVVGLSLLYLATLFGAVALGVSQWRASS